MNTISKISQLLNSTQEQTKLLGAIELTRLNRFKIGDFILHEVKDILPLAKKYTDKGIHYHLSTTIYLPLDITITNLIKNKPDYTLPIIQSFLTIDKEETFDITLSEIEDFNKIEAYPNEYDHDYFIKSIKEKLHEQGIPI